MTNAGGRSATLATGTRAIDRVNAILLHPDAEGMMVIREGSASFTTEAELHVARDIAAHHDVLLFIARTTRTHPTPTGYRERPV
ncbi:MAG TPA: hypothetical protein VEW66_04975 [Thermomicrobiales bacterium]|nr:hypothetical protein [Thermomicrobiales bacterium]